MFKKIILILCLTSIIIGCDEHIASKNSKETNYISFSKVYFDNIDGYRLDNGIENSEKTDLISVLVYHGIEVKLSNDGDISIPSYYYDSNDDLALLMTVTNKARDEEWLQLRNLK